MSREAFLKIHTLCIDAINLTPSKVIADETAPLRHAVNEIAVISYDSVKSAEEKDKRIAELESENSETLTSNKKLHISLAKATVTILELQAQNKELVEALDNIDDLMNKQDLYKKSQWSIKAKQLLGKPTNQEIRIWYMNDNHTFTRLTLNFDESIAIVKKQWAKGYTSGMLCFGDYKPDGFKEINCNYSDLNKFEKEMCKLYEALAKAK